MKQFKRAFLAILALLALTLGIVDIRYAHAATITVTNINDTGPGSLRKAILNAAAGDTIIFDATLSGETIYLTAPLTLSKNVNIDGSALAAKIILSGDTDQNGTGDIQVLIVNSGVTATLNSLMITKGSFMAGSGGGIYSSGNLTIINSTIVENSADTGGGIYQNGGALTVTNSTISGNPAIYRGGGIYNNHGSLTISNSQVTHNSVRHYGAGINNAGGTLTVKDSTLSDNIANNLSTPSNNDASIETGTEVPGRGGAINHYDGGTLSITNSVISNNYAGFDGGAVAYRPSTTGQASLLSIFNSTISNNSAGNEGGGLSMDGDTLTKIINSTFSGNTSGYTAGAIYNSLGVLTVMGSRFTGNAAENNGGAIYYSSGSLTVVGSLFDDNSAGGSGGGIYNTYNALAITNSTFAKNSAVNHGGGIYHQNGLLKMTNSTLAANSAAAGGGGGVLIAAGKMNYTNSLIANSVKGGDCINHGTMDVHTNNLVKDGSCLATLTGDPKIGPLADNGGPNQTFALLANSPAINAGVDVNCPATDQRGVTRPQGAHCDIGAYEYVYTATATPTVTPTLDGTVIATEIPTETATPTVTSTPLETSTPSKTRVTLLLTSLAAQDGWVLEAGETTNAGGSTPKSTAATFSLGDDAGNRQYRGMLSFRTGAGIPDNASITGVLLKVKVQGIIGGGNPVATFKGFMLDIKNGYFGTAAALQIVDFQANASGVVGPLIPAPVGTTYNLNLTSAKAFINKLATNNGLTQIRLRFKLDDNNNAIANLLNLYSGSAVNAADRPQLVITYTTP